MAPRKQGSGVEGTRKGVWRSVPPVDRDALSMEHQAQQAGEDGRLGDLLNILMVAEDAGAAHQLRDALASVPAPPQYSLTHVTRLGDALQVLSRQGSDLVMLDATLPDSSGWDGLLALQAHAPDVPIIMLNGHDEAAGFEAVRLGAYDYVARGQMTGYALARSLRHAIEHSRLREHVRRQAEAFKVAYERLAMLVDNVDISLSIMDREGRMQMVNDAYEQRTGFSREQVIGRRYLEFDPSEEMEAYQQIVNRVMATGEPAVFRDLYVQHAGRPEGLYVDASVQPILGDDGTVIGVLSVTVDVTEKVLARQEIEAQQALLKTIYETVPVALIVYDRDMRILDMNPAQARMSRINPDEIRGKILYEVAPASRERQETHERAMAGEEIDTTNIFYVFSDGDTGYVDIRYRPVRDANRAITGILSTATDVTERVRAEQEVERQRARLEAILEGAPVGIAFYDREMRYLSLNREYARITGRDREALYGQSLYELFPQSRVRKPVHDRVFAGEAIDEHNIPVQYPDNPETLYLDFHYRPVRDAGGEVVGLLSVMIDVTERHRVEEQKDEFIALASHELKTPLTAIKGYSQLVLRLMPNPVDERMGRMLRVVGKKADFMTGLINEMLDVSRMERGELPLQRERFDLAGYVREIVGNLRLTAPDFAVTCDCPDAPLMVSADMQRIEQVITNLVNNAIKYSGDSRKVEVTIRRQGDEAVTAVRDYGLGIPAGQLGQVFGRFFRASNAMSAHYPGLGLGLYLSHGIIARHGGRMWVHSAEGEGSTFYFDLPIVESE